MRRSRGSSTALAALLLGVALFPSCGSHKKRSEIPVTSTTSTKCPAPIVMGKGYFYNDAGMNQAQFQLIGTFDGAMGSEETRHLFSVDVYGAPGSKTAADLIADPDKFKLTTITASPFWWGVDGLPTTTAESAWIDGQPYTIAVRHNYELKSEPEAHVEACNRAMTMRFDVKTSPWVKGTDIGVPDGGSTGASVSVSGLFYGAQGYALYEGEIIYDNIVGSTKVAEKIELFSANVATPSVLYATGNRFKTKAAPPALPLNTWSFPSIRDWNYNGSDEWYVGVRVTYTAASGGGFSDSSPKMFTGLSAKQGTPVPGE